MRTFARAEHSEVAGSLNDLAIVYFYQGSYAESEPPQKRAPAIWEKALGRDHPDVARGLNGLAQTFRDKRRYQETEGLLSQALWRLERGRWVPIIR
jgi:tetratricopeptide (TPR) repeat protein